jgi:hypothetical protein
LNARNGSEAWSRPTTGLGSTNFRAPIHAKMNEAQERPGDALGQGNNR